ncbi:MAG: DUF3394 domain-containing protein, partial [Parasporobacterium sp.]|nr:DUF3394 domain-containing protein [Parasporobacterium sp.]
MRASGTANVPNYFEEGYYVKVAAGTGHYMWNNADNIKAFERVNNRFKYTTTKGQNYVNNLYNSNPSYSETVSGADYDWVQTGYYVRVDNNSGQEVIYGLDHRGNKINSQISELEGAYQPLVGFDGNTFYAYQAFYNYYSLRTAILPFLFIFNTDLLLIDVGWTKGILVFITATIGILVFTAATMGWFFTKNKKWETVVLIFAAFLLFRPGFVMERISPTAYSIEPVNLVQEIEKTPVGQNLMLKFFL